MSTRARDGVLLGLGALLIRLPAYFAPRHLGFDDGQFAESVLAMRAGGLPFRQVFSSQGPLFLPLAWLGDLLTFQTLDSPRAIAIASGVALTVVTYIAGRELTSRAGALLAAGLVALSGSMLWTTGPLTSDGPGELLATSAVTLAIIYRRRPSTAKAIWIGVLAGAAFSVKSLLVLPALVAVAIVLLAGKRWRHIALVGVAAIGVALAVSVPWGLGRVYEQSVLYHTDQAAQREIGANLSKSARTLFERDAPLLAAALVAAIGAFVLRRRTRATEAQPPRRGLIAICAEGAGPIVVWFGLAAVVLLLEAPMWRNHLSHLVVPAALLVGVAATNRTVAIAAATAGLVMIPWSAAHLTELVFPHPYEGRDLAGVELLRRLPPGALAISDDPGLVWHAGRRTPTQFVDASILRINSRRPGIRIDEDTVVRAARAHDVCAVVRWSTQRFNRFRGLGHRLRSDGYVTRLAEPGSPRLIWVKRDCDPTGPARAAARAGPASATAAPVRSPG